MTARIPIYSSAQRLGAAVSRGRPRWQPPRFAMAGIAALLLLLPGCGGGGGPRTAAGRSYSYRVGGRSVAVTFDASGRFTVTAVDDVALPTGSAAQGALGSDGRFSVLSETGLVQFDGFVVTGATAVECTVRPNGASAFMVTAALVPPATPPPAAYQGTFAGTSGTDKALISADPTGHGALWVQTAGASGGDSVAIDAIGSISSVDGGTSGRLYVSGTVTMLEITRIRGAAVSLNLALASSSRAKWTFMVFLNGANNLQSYGALNVNQMEMVGSSPDINMLVQWKQENCASCGTPEWLSTRRYLVKKDLDSGRIRSQLLEDMGRGIDMGDWRELRSFIAWSQQRFPADHYALVIWNHGAGWRNTRSVSIDDATGNEIQTWQLPQALNVSPRLDMVIFDASLMQMLEVAYEIRNSTDVVVGSEESPPGEGYVYDGFLGDLAANPTMTAPQFGAKIVTRTLAAYGTGSNITQSALDTSKLQTVADKLSLFANSLSAHSSSQRAVLVAAREQAEHYLYSENKDLWHYAELVRANSNSAPLRNAATAVQQAIGDALIAEGHGSQHADSHGIAVYLPSPASYLTTYANLALSRVTDWDLWLQSQPP